MPAVLLREVVDAGVPWDGKVDCLVAGSGDVAERVGRRGDEVGVPDRSACVPDEHPSGADAPAGAVALDEPLTLERADEA